MNQIPEEETTEELRSQVVPEETVLDLEAPESEAEAEVEAESEAEAEAEVEAEAEAEVEADTESGPEEETPSKPGDEPEVLEDGFFTIEDLSLEELKKLGGRRRGGGLRGFFGKKRNRVITAVVILIIGLGVGGFCYYRYQKTISGEEVYVSSVATITGAAANGMINRFPGVVESRETWSSKLDSGKEIKEYKVQVGDEVKKGDELFVYDTTEIEESLDDAKLEIKRLQDDIAAIDDDIRELNTEKNEGGNSSELTVEIQQQESEKRSKNTEIEAKKDEVKKLQKQIDESTVKSAINGVIKSIYDENAEVVSEDAITVVNTKNFQVKAKVNEQNLVDVTQDMAVMVFSRVDDSICWRGTINKIDTESPLSNSGTTGVYEDESSEGDGMSSTSSYAFYVALENYDGLNMGQHVYVEPDVGQNAGDDSDVIKLDAYMIDLSDEEHPFVWKANDRNHLEKQEIELGAYDELTDKYEIIGGLSLSDKIAQPDDTLREGMKCVEMSQDDESEEEGAEGEDLTDDEGTVEDAAEDAAGEDAAAGDAAADEATEATDAADPAAQQAQPDAAADAANADVGAIEEVN